MSKKAVAQLGAAPSASGISSPTAGDMIPPSPADFFPDELMRRLERIEEFLGLSAQAKKSMATGGVHKFYDEYRLQKALNALMRGDKKPLDQYFRDGGTAINPNERRAG